MATSIWGKISGLFSAKKITDTFQINLSDRAAIADEFRKIVADSGNELCRESVNDCYFNESIKEKSVLLVGLGKNVRGNLQYLLNELNHSEEYSEFKMYVRTGEETEDIVQNYIRQNDWKRTVTVLDNAEYRELLESANYLITEVYFPESWVKKPGQVYINIWHGTPLKKLGLAKNSDNAHKNGITQKNFIDADYLLYPNDYTRKNMLESYKVAGLMQGRILMQGYPRSSGMLQAAAEDLTELKKRLAPNGEKIYAYMPTFKDYLSSEEVVAEAQELLDYLDAGLNENQILYVNLHHKIHASLDFNRFKRICSFPSDVDSYRLLAASEALLTDYSSVFYDYLVLRKHIILYIPDYALYKEKRGTYMELTELPFDMAKTKEEVLQAINTGKKYDDTEAFERFCGYDSADNAKNVCRLMLGEKAQNGLNLSAIPSDTKYKGMVYSVDMAPGTATELLYQVTKNYDRQTSEIYLGCGMEEVDADKSGAYPMMFENSVIGTGIKPHLSALGRTILRLYKEGGLSFDKAMECVKYDFALMARRMFGQAKFDKVVIYDVSDPQVILALTEIEAPKALFLTESLIRKMENGNTFAKDAVDFAIRYSEQVCTGSQKLKSRAAAVLGKEAASWIKVIDTPEKLADVILK